MITYEKCPNCDDYRFFYKEGNHDSPNIPWRCKECGFEIVEFDPWPEPSH